MAQVDTRLKINGYAATITAEVLNDGAESGEFCIDVRVAVNGKEYSIFHITPDGLKQSCELPEPQEVWCVMDGAIHVRD